MQADPWTLRSRGDEPVLVDLKTLSGGFLGLTAQAEQDARLRALRRGVVVAVRTPQVLPKTPHFEPYLFFPWAIASYMVFEWLLRLLGKKAFLHTEFFLSKKTTLTPL
jgi:hypothetical protein